MKPSRRTRGWSGLVAGVVVFGLATGPQFSAELASATSATTSSTVATSSTTTSVASGSTTTTLSGSTTTTLPTGSTTTTLPVTRRVTSPVWPTMGSAALAIPQLSVAASSPRQPVVPIASLTKLMTVWIVLHQFPLTNSGLGACETVSARDVALYRHDVAQQQSVVAIALGQRICERTLLRGVIVHSAGDYAQLLAQLTDLPTNTFVALMNREALAMGMIHTHYVDETGISSGDVSTASDQLIITVAVMTNEPLIRSIATLTKVWLPVQGVVGTFTPDLGYDGVAGVKSGYTEAAGGCDAMAVNLRLNTTVVTTYIVVLGQQSNNALALAGSVALALYRSIRPSIARVVTPSGVQVEWIGSLADVTSPSPTPANAYW
ncbi:MAG: hypothetical protein KGJ42_02830 [Acidobacteriota bacterium]|nr:hypothetical protein [Acidobacteriota bacterium]